MKNQNGKKKTSLKLFSFSPLLLLIPAYITNLFTDVTREDVKMIVFLSVALLLFLLLISVWVATHRIVKQLKKINRQFANGQKLIDNANTLSNEKESANVESEDESKIIIESERVEEVENETKNDDLAVAQEEIIAENSVEEPTEEIDKSDVVEEEKESVDNKEAVETESVATAVVENNENTQEDNDNAEDDSDAVQFRGIDELSGLAIAIRLNKSYTAKLMQADEETKRYYEQIKNAILSYGSVKSKISFQHEIFSKGRRKLVKCFMRGKTLSIYFALDPKTFENTRFKVEDVSSQKKHVETPCLYRIKNARRVQYAIELIKQLMEDNGIEFTNQADEKYVDKFAYKKTDELIEMGLIKEVETKVSMESFVAKYGEIKRS